MAVKRIGLEAVLEVGAFTAAVEAYNAKVRGMGKVGDDFATKTGQQFTLMSGPVSSVVNLIGGALVGAFAVAGASAIAFGTTGIQVAADFEAKMSGVTAILGGAKDEVKELSDLALGLGMDPNLTVSASGAAGVVETLARNGIKLEDIMGGAARGTILLANAVGDAGFTTSADIASKTMKIFGIEGQDFERAVNGITGVVNSSTFDINDYALALAQGGGVAARVGVSYEDFNTVITGLSSSFTSGSDAGTSFKTFLTRLVPASEEAAGLMEELSLDFFDAQGALKPMSEIVQELHDGFKGLTDEQRNNAAATIFGTDSMRAALAMAEMTEDQFLSLQDELAGANAEEMAKTRVDNLKGALDVLAGAWETLQIKVMTGNLPFLKETALAAAGAVAWLAGGFDAAAAALSATSDPLGLIVGQLIGMAPWLTPVIDGVKAIAAAFIEDMPLIQAYVADAGAFLGQVFGQALPAIMTNVGTLLQMIAAGWREHGENIMAVINFAWRVITTTISVALTLVSGLITGFFQYTSGDTAAFWTTMGVTFTSALGQITSIVGVSLGQFVESWRGTFELAGLIIKQKWEDFVVSQSQGLLNLLAGLGKAKDDFIKAGEDLVKGLIDGAAAMAQGFINTIVGMVENALRAAREAFGINSPSTEYRKRLGQPIGEGAVRGVEDYTSAFASAVERLAAGGLRPPVLQSPLSAGAGAGGSNSVVNYWNYQPTYAGAPASPAQDFAMLRVMAGG